MEFSFESIEGFEWDAGNLTKSAGKHGVAPEEAEEVFFRGPLVLDATRAEDREARYAALGATERGRILRVVFTVRGTRIRPISCRTASRKEIAAYEKALRQGRQ
jgi:uncharacterized protein